MFSAQCLRMARCFKAIPIPCIFLMHFPVTRCAARRLCCASWEFPPKLQNTLCVSAWKHDRMLPPLSCRLSYGRVVHEKWMDGWAVQYFSHPPRFLFASTFFGTTPLGRGTVFQSRRFGQGIGQSAHSFVPQCARYLGSARIRYFPARPWRTLVCPSGGRIMGQARRSRTLVLVGMLAGT